MIDYIILGALIALGFAIVGFLVYWVVLWVTWPFRLKEDLRNERKWHENTRGYLKAEQERKR